MNKNSGIDLNILILSLITLNIFPNYLLSNLFGHKFSSFPFLTTIIIISLLFKNIKNFQTNYTNKNLILFFIITTFVISLNQSLIEKKILILIRYSSPIVLSFLIFQYLVKNNKNDISNIIIIILIIFLSLFFIQKANVLYLDDIFCYLINKYELIDRGHCYGRINAETFLSSEPSYHALNLFGIFILYKYYMASNHITINKKKDLYIHILFLLNLIIIKSAIAKIFLFFFIFYLFIFFYYANNLKKTFIIFTILFYSPFILFFTYNLIKKGYEINLATIQSRFYYSTVALKNINIMPKEFFLNFKRNEIDNLISEKNLLELTKIPVVRLDIYKGNQFNLNSSFLYFIYDFGLILSVPFLLLNFIILKNLFFYVKNFNFVLIIPYYIISIIFQSNFSNILMWLILFYICKER